MIRGNEARTLTDLVDDSECLANLALYLDERAFVKDMRYAVSVAGRFVKS